VATDPNIGTENCSVWFGRGEEWYTACCSERFHVAGGGVGHANSRTNQRVHARRRLRPAVWQVHLSPPIDPKRSCGQKTGPGWLCGAIALASGLAGRRLFPWRCHPAIASFDASRRMSSELRICGSKFWPKATFTVAWGNAPGRNGNIGSLAEGHIHRTLFAWVNMAFGQKRPDDNAVLGRCPRLRWEEAFGQTRPTPGSPISRTTIRGLFAAADECSRWNVARFAWPRDFVERGPAITFSESKEKACPARGQCGRITAVRNGDGRRSATARTICCNRAAIAPRGLVDRSVAAD